ncbi:MULTISPECIES: VENN motif pre-toxin domain-containing protein, partial [unclassified Pseudomonas]
TDAAKEELAKSGIHNPTREQIQNSAAYKAAMQDFGTGGKYQQVAQAVTAALQGLAGGDIGSALAGASAPYLATVIKEQTAGNDAARIMAQAVLGAVVAQAQGNSASAGAAGAATGELIAAQLYPGKSPEQLTESEKQTVSALSSLAAGLIGGALTGDSAGAIAGAQAGKNAVENNHLSTDEKISLKLKEVQYQRDCQGGASNSGLCQQLRKDIQALREKGRSVLETELLAPASDMGPENTVKTKPGEIIPCVGSSNGFCQVTDQVLVTDQGKEWQLVPASDEQAQIGKAQQQSIGAQADAALKKWTADAFDVGCGGFGVAATACQLYRAIGGENPISGAVPSTGAQVLWGATAILNGLGIYGVVAEGSAIGKSPFSSTVSADAEAGSSGLPSKGSLKGDPEVPPKNANPEMVRSLDRQNEAAIKLAQAGYDVEQLPNIGKNKANPDLRINGEIADVASPRTGSVGSVLMTVEDKVKRQAPNVVINLADSPLSIEQVSNALESRPIQGLKTLFLMKDGEFKVIKGG